MADKQVTPFQLTDQFTMNNFNQRINETNTALENIDTYTKQQIEEINTALQNIDVYTKAQTLSDATKLQYGLNSNAIPDDVFKCLFPAMPTGTISWLASETIPSGFLKCDGSSVAKEDYPELYSVIGDTFGTGTDTTFQLPDLRAKFIRGAGTNGDYSATFGKTQGGSILISNSGRFPTVSDSEFSKVVPTNMGYTFGGGDSGQTAYSYGLRPYNIVLTPIIKYCGG